MECLGFACHFWMRSFRRHRETSLSTSPLNSPSFHQGDSTFENSDHELTFSGPYGDASLRIEESQPLMLRMAMQLQHSAQPFCLHSAMACLSVGTSSWTLLCSMGVANVVGVLLCFRVCLLVGLQFQTQDHKDPEKFGKPPVPDQRRG